MKVIRKLLFIAFTFLIGFFFGSWSAHDGTGLPLAEADGDTVIAGEIVGSFGLKDHHGVIFHPDGSRFPLYVVPDRHYRDGERAEMILLPGTVVQIQNFHLR